MAVAQLFSLLADYATSKGASQQLDVHDFAEWLATQGHGDVMQAIGRNQTTLVSIKAALAEGRSELLERLTDLDRKFSAVAVGAGPLGEVAKALRPSSVLSEQAQRILREFEDTQASSAQEHRNTGRGGGYEMLFLDAGRTEAFQMAEQRFYHDDINQLLSLSMLTCTHTAKTRVFRITRLGSQVAQQLVRDAGRT